MNFFSPPSIPWNLSCINIGTVCLELEPDIGSHYSCLPPRYKALWSHVSLMYSRMFAVLYKFRQTVKKKVKIA